MLKRRYRLNYGTYRQDNKKYNAGDEVDSKHKLDQMFEKGHFTLLPPKYQPGGEKDRNPKPITKGRRKTTPAPEPVEPAPAPPPETEPVESEPETATEALQVVHRDGGWYDVVNPVTGQPINDKALREDAARALAADHDG